MTYSDSLCSGKKTQKLSNDVAACRKMSYTAVTFFCRTLPAITAGRCRCMIAFSFLGLSEGICFWHIHCVSFSFRHLHLINTSTQGKPNEKARSLLPKWTQNIFGKKEKTLKKDKRETLKRKFAKDSKKAMNVEKKTQQEKNKSEFWQLLTTRRASLKPLPCPSVPWLFGDFFA